MKYIIDIPDECLDKPHQVSMETREKIGNNSYVVSWDLHPIPYRDLNRESIEDEVWDFTWKMFDLGLYECMNIFGRRGRPSDYREAKAIYELWQKEHGSDQDEIDISIGDEVTYRLRETQWNGVVVKICNNYLSILLKDGTVFSDLKRSQLQKTGRHFSEIKEMFDQLKE